MTDGRVGGWENLPSSTFTGAADGWEPPNTFLNMPAIFPERKELGYLFNPEFFSVECCLGKRGRWGRKEKKQREGGIRTHDKVSVGPSPLRS